MHDVNCWLIALAFVLGLLLTFAFIIRRVKGEIPASVSFGGAAGPAAGAAGAAHLTSGKAPSEAEAAKIVIGDGPYGAGSVRAGAGGSGPAGWSIKGNEDSMLYHGPASPAYDVTIAEVWFVDEQTAQAAGFGRWDSQRKNKKK